VISGSNGPSSVSLEPGKVLEGSPKDLLYGKQRVVVLIADHLVSMEMELSVFLSKSYPIHRGIVLIGSKRLNINKLTISVGVKYVIEDLSGMIDTELD
jgi:hypothetical protein